MLPLTLLYVYLVQVSLQSLLFPIFLWQPSCCFRCCVVATAPVPDVRGLDGRLSKLAQMRCVCCGFSWLLSALAGNLQVLLETIFTCRQQSQAARRRGRGCSYIQQDYRYCRLLLQNYCDFPASPAQLNRIVEK